MKQAKKNFIMLLSMSMLSTILFGCGLKENLENKFANSNVDTTKVGMQENRYVIDVSSINGENNINIDLPEGFTAIGDTDETSNAYVSLYHADTSAKQDDYVITYSIKKTIEEDREETLHTYKHMYSNFIASEITTCTLENDIECRYYTITYMLSGETLTDYIFEFNKDGINVLSKLGTTFYPLNISEIEAGELLYKHLN